MHNTARKSLYVPTKSTCPVPLDHLLPERKTEFQLETGEPDMIEDRWTDKNIAPIEKPLTGRTHFTIADTPATTVPILDRAVPSSSSSSGKKKDDKRTLMIFRSCTKNRKNLRTLQSPRTAIHSLILHLRCLLLWPEFISVFSNKKELLKLHMKHHHMSYEQFKHRTHALHLPTETYDLYKSVIEECETCQKSKTAPTRSKTSGLRSEVFGEMTFMDHCEITTPTRERIIVLTVLDGATTLLTSSPVSSKSEPESIKFFREYVDQYHLQPKYVVADQAFMTPDQAFMS